MKAKFHQFKAFITKHIWADFLFIFVLHFLISLLSKKITGNDKLLEDMLFMSAGFSLVMTPIFRIMRPTEKEHNLYDMVDHVRHYQIGQRPELKAFLETQGYAIDHNDGAVSYFKSEQDNIFSTRKTFLHETDHWIALVASPEILDRVPDSIISIYPLRQKQS